MTAAYSAWGSMGGENFALPMVKLTPTDMVNQGYTLYWNTTQQGLDYAPLSFDPASGDGSLAANFNIGAGKFYKVNTTQVLGARRTGWTAWTGTASRATQVSDAATLAQVATAFKALVDDLIAHGIIGA